MQHELSRFVSLGIIGLVALGFCFVGAVLIYNENRLARESEQLATSGIEAVATVTGHEIETSGSNSFDTYYAITFTFPDQAGTIWSGETRPYTDSDTWFQTPTLEDWSLDADIVEGDQILVTYLPDDPSIHRPIDECRNCADLGGLGDKLATYVGIVFILLGAFLLFALRRRGVAPRA